MRTIYVCLGCAAHYLPPVPMTYPALGLTASPVHCGAPACRSAVAPMMAGVGVPVETVARWTRRAAGLDGARRSPRPGRRARGRRAGAAPRSARSKLL
ncbi:hypothetical protein [Streptomyces sp. NPDC014894]|uniref:hypothetical protein n=1 Tax=unclassified Streptomyces TaxID=2593676 RepID=UPI0036F88B48